MEFRGGIAIAYSDPGTDIGMRIMFGATGDSILRLLLEGKDVWFPPSPKRSPWHNA